MIEASEPGGASSSPARSRVSTERLELGLPRVAGALVALILLVGCGSGGALGAPPDEYAAFRKSRLAPTLDQRLAASVQYLDQYPSGVFTERVTRYVQRAEPLYFASKKGSVRGLRAYLKVLPTGPHAREAARLLAGASARSAADAELGRAATETEARLERAARERAEAAEQVGAWLRRFIEPAAWGVAFSQAPADVVVPWSLGLPAPICEPVSGPPGAGAGTRRCTKIVELPYAIPVGGAREERQITLELAATQDDRGALTEVVIGGPDLFGRLEETRTVRPFAQADAADRAAAAARAAELVRAAFSRKIELAPGCARAALPPVVLELACGGLRVVVRSGGGGQDDAIAISRLGPTPETAVSAPPR